MYSTTTTSLSARRAWIEIVEEVPNNDEQTVALRKESVDRNCQAVSAELRVFSSLSARRAWIEISRAANCQHRSQSLSARRAWIEIIGLTYDGLIASVALRKESVDRNVLRFLPLVWLQCRSPQGERG